MSKKKEVGKDDYGNPVYEGQIAVKDAHGNRVFRDADVGTGPDHHADKHRQRKGSVNTGKKDAHGNDIWTNPADDEGGAAATED